MNELTSFVQMTRTQPPPANMLNDEPLNGLTWSDIQGAWREIASPENQAHVEDFTSALWKLSIFLPEAMNLQKIMTAAVLLSGPACFPASVQEVQLALPRWRSSG